MKRTDVPYFEENKRKKLLKITINTWENASRDMRELSVVNELGADVLVMAKGEKTGKIEAVNEFPVYRMSTRPWGNGLPEVINRAVSFFTWAHMARRLQPEVISGHDLIALSIGWMSTLFSSKTRHIQLVYDSHEYELGRMTAKKRSKLKLFLIKKWEKYLINKCVFSIMVNDSIADEVMKAHRMKKRPVVVRNIPNYWYLNQEEIRKTRKAICRELKIQEDSFLIMFHGNLGPGNGIENIIKALAKISDVYLILLGGMVETNWKSMNTLIDDLKVRNRVLIKPFVPLSILYQYVGAVNLGCMPIEASSLSYYYALPNKLFENIQALTPVLVSDLPEMKKIVNKYNIGKIVRQGNVEDIVEAIVQVKENNQKYELYKENLKKAKEELCWEKESEILAEAYRPYLSQERGVYV